jgi:hypothetical protein
MHSAAEGWSREVTIDGPSKAWYPQILGSALDASLIDARLIFCVGFACEAVAWCAGLGAGRRVLLLLKDLRALGEDSAKSCLLGLAAFLYVLLSPLFFWSTTDGVSFEKVG